MTILAANVLVVLVAVEVLGVTAVPEETAEVVVAYIGLVVEQFALGVPVVDEHENFDVAKQRELHRFLEETFLALAVGDLNLAVSKGWEIFTCLVRSCLIFVIVIFFLPMCGFCYSLKV